MVKEREQCQNELQVSPPLCRNRANSQTWLSFHIHAPISSTAVSGKACACSENLAVFLSRGSLFAQKLKDIIGYAAAPNDYKNRQSFLPDCGPLYETVRQVQASIAKKMAKQEAQQQQQQQQQPAISEEQDATAKEMADKVSCVCVSVRV
eukprot:1794671-Rhodomonas_salina.1